MESGSANNILSINSQHVVPAQLCQATTVPTHIPTHSHTHCTHILSHVNRTDWSVCLVFNSLSLSNNLKQKTEQNEKINVNIREGIGILILRVISEFPTETRPCISVRKSNYKVIS